jgi:Retroviral aspartyl protease
MDGQIRGLTHQGPHCVHEQRREEGPGRRRRETWSGFLKWRTASTSAPPLYIFSVHETDNNNFFYIDAIIETHEKNEPIETWPLVDSGAGGTFMDQNYTRKHGFNLTKLEYPITARNVDGTKNKQGTIRYYTDLDIQVNGKMNTERFLITGLENQKIILGLPWLREYNPEINWKEGTLQWRTTTMEEVLDEEEHLNRPTNTSDEVLLEYLGMENELWINSKENLATKLASEANQKKPDLTPEQLVPQEYHDYLDIFDKDKANRFPDTRPWDHKIEMKSGFEPKSFKTYNLTHEEQVELDKFLKENLDKGYIKPSQSPMASPFFFVKKKDGKLRPCQDY